VTGATQFRGHTPGSVLCLLRVTPIADNSAAPEAPTSAAAAPPSPRSRRSKFIAGGLVVSGIVALLAMALGSRWMAVDRPGLLLDLTKARITRVTESGKAPNGAMSHDGRYVAYGKNEGDEYSLWVEQTGTGGKAQVVPRQPQVLSHLTFSPDGEYVYFARGAAGTAVDETSIASDHLSAESRINSEGATAE